MKPDALQLLKLVKLPSQHDIGKWNDVNGCFSSDVARQWICIQGYPAQAETIGLGAELTPEVDIKRREHLVLVPLAELNPRFRIYSGDKTVWI
ncbi:hypothetical protein CGRA01v4_13918 [Colletotrichum graminicola]|nr:hypothetical protein CGRA01v4_13918 [Colletotrichum graminicola]